MRLTRLELSGFKSFAKTTVLEFPSAVTAIVGPNGSGKSNIKEAIQWVLGEQSMKSLRGKKGEDLVWNGSADVPRMGKASVALVFDNADKKIGLEFDEVVVARKIFRDGVNEYAINDSPVRLRDVVEMMARVGLGESKHNIIGQGEVDRVLLASAKDRYHMLEEALGLRVYHLKKNETERRLEATEQNMAQAEALIREIVPHLKFLRASAEKAGSRQKLEVELREWERVYCSREEEGITAEKERIASRVTPFAEQEARMQKEIARLSSLVTEAERSMVADAGEHDAEKQLAALHEKRREVERELGRLEGKLEAAKEESPSPASRAVDTGYLHEEIGKILAAARLVVQDEDRMDVMRARLAAFCTELERLIAEIKEGRAIGAHGKTGAVNGRTELEAGIQSVHTARVALTAQIEKYTRLQEERQGATRDRYRSIRQMEVELHTYQDALRESALERQKISFEEERVAMREGELAREYALSGISRAEITAFPAASRTDAPSVFTGGQEELMKKIQRGRIRLEEIGAIDPATIKEYEDTETRHAFLTRELEDLKKASVSLKDLIKELERHIKKDFREGFAGIKNAFSEYFKLIFGGGRASLILVKQESRSMNQGEEDEETEITEENEDEDSAGGVEISVELPRKRIKGLAMLSGGERALASIALLFAISAVNPPPFLILDETDAALDEANSERFGALLKELSKKTQLLVITHNRETMKSAGILYGVTMGQDGVSKLLSLKLEQAEAYTNR